jgi:hypothetical protein
MMVCVCGSCRATKRGLTSDRLAKTNAWDAAVRIG